MTTPIDNDKITVPEKPPKQWADVTRKMLDNSLTSVDDDTLLRLAKARKHALSATHRHLNPFALWGSVAASIAVITLLSLQLNQDRDQTLPNSDENLAVLLEDMDILEHMEILSAMEELGSMVNDA